MSGGFFRGTSTDQDTRFSNKQAKLLKSQKFPPELDHLVDTSKVKMDMMKPWIAKRVTELLGYEDEVLINFICALLEEKEADGKKIQIQLTEFMKKNTVKFMKELWSLLLSAQQNASGVPQQFLDAKEAEIQQRKAEDDRIAQETQQKHEKDGRDSGLEKRKMMDGDAGSSRSHGVGLALNNANVNAEEEKEVEFIRSSRTKNRTSQSFERRSPGQGKTCIEQSAGRRRSRYPLPRRQHYPSPQRSPSSRSTNRHRTRSPSRKIGSASYRSPPPCRRTSRPHGWRRSPDQGKEYIAQSPSSRSSESPSPRSRSRSPGPRRQFSLSPACSSLSGSTKRERTRSPPNFGSASYHSSPRWRSKTEINFLWESSEEDRWAAAADDYHEYEDDFAKNLISWKSLYNLRIGCIYKSEGSLEVDIARIREAYDAFLGDFPFSVEHWKKYAEHEKSLSASDKVLDVYERAVTAVPDSLEVWCSYCHFAISTYDEHIFIRSLFERALIYVGKKYNSSTLWDLYLMYEDSCGEWYNVASIYRRVLKLPIKDLDWYLECFKRFIHLHNLEEILTPEDLIVINGVSKVHQNSEDVALSQAAKLQLCFGFFQEDYEKAKKDVPSVIEKEKASKPTGLCRPNCLPWSGFKSVVTLPLPDFLELNLHKRDVNFTIDSTETTTVLTSIGTRLLKGIFRGATNEYLDGFCWDGMVRPEHILVTFDGSSESDVFVVFLKHATVKISKEGILADEVSWRTMLWKPFTLSGRSVKYLASLFSFLQAVPKDVDTNTQSRVQWIETVLSNPIFTFIAARLWLFRKLHEIYWNSPPAWKILFDTEFKKIRIPGTLASTIRNNRLLAAVYWFPKEKAHEKQEEENRKKHEERRQQYLAMLRNNQLNNSLGSYNNLMHPYQKKPFIRSTAVMDAEFLSGNLPFIITLIRHFESHALDNFMNLGISINNLEEVEQIIDFVFEFLLPLLIMALQRIAPSIPTIASILQSFRSSN